MTADALIEERRQCLETGMDDFVSKPVRVEVLIAALQRLKANAADLGAVRLHHLTSRLGSEVKAEQWLAVTRLATAVKQEFLAVQAALQKVRGA
jgi:CheY-like chemotaxis protein